MAKKTWVKINGAWRNVKYAWLNVSGSWQKITPKGNIGGVWKEFIQYFLMLYNEGRPLVPMSKVGGFEGGGTVTFQSDHIYLKSGTSSAQIAAVSPDGLVDVTDYSKLKCLITKPTASSAQTSFGIGLKNTRDAKSSGFMAYYSTTNTYTSPIELELDISGIAGEWYVIGRLSQGALPGEARIYKLWLE